MSEWITHDGGGKFPVPIDAIVDAAMVGGKILESRPARGLNWARVVSYRLVQPAPAAAPMGASDYDAFVSRTLSMGHPPPEPLARDMTKRERFAMAAMQGLLAEHEVNEFTARNAAFCVECADKLLAALQEKPE